MVAPSELIVNPKNFRGHGQGQRALFRAIANEVGVVGAVLVRETADGLELVDGEMRSEELAGMLQIPALITDLTDDEVRKVLATFDAISGMADVDVGMQADLVRGLDSEEDALRGFLDEVEAAMPDLRDIDAPAGEQSSDGRRSISGDMVMMPVAVDGVATVERALRATGEMNRGKALLTICLAYLDEER